MRDDAYYKDLITSLDDSTDPMEGKDIDKLIAFIKSIGDRTDEDGDLEDAYETMDPEDFLMMALGESDGGGDDSVGGDTIDDDTSNGIPDSADEPEDDTDDKKSDDKKDTVSDSGVKNVVKRKRGRPPKQRSEPRDDTQLDIAKALSGLRFF